VPFLGLISERAFIEEYMNYKLNPYSKSTNKTLPYFLLKQGIGLVGAFSLLINNMAIAQTATTGSTQQITTSEAPTTALKARKIKLKVSQLNDDNKPQKVTKLTDKSNSYNNRSNIYIADSGKNSYIDTTNYNAAPPPANNPAPTTTTQTQQRNQPKVVITERSSGCSVVSGGSGVQSNGCGGSRRQTSRTRTRTTTVQQPTRNVTQNRVRRTTNTSDRVATRNQPVFRQSQFVASKRVLSRINQNESVVSQNHTKSNGKPLQKLTGSRPLTVVSLPEELQAIPLSEYANYVASRNLSNIQPNNTTAIEQTDDRLTAANTNTNIDPAKKTALLYPLSIPARFSSPFGWRIHPISGSARMHSGTDIAAPLGTPVLATYSGRVEVANNMGGYGLTVTIRHANDTQESLYAHLSQILVQSGEYVEKGTVIGLVGSTGNSTGPHLHFEWRYLTTDGWVAVDAGQHLEYALDNLIQAMQMAKIAGDTEENKTESKTTDTKKVTEEKQKSEVDKQKL
jgi:murein DD-endopeptidase MepM/ murein hydrolase activator NlpD